jgi:hypothetical protein
MLRRRPLMRAAVVGGTAYYAGKKVSQGRQAEADQNAQIADLQAQQQQQAYQQQPVYQQPPAAAPAGGAESVADQIERLKGLLDSGALTPEEYSAAKQQVLQGG